MPLPKRRVRQQLESQLHIAGQGPFACAHDDRRQEQVALVHQAGPEGLGGQVRAADAQVPLRLSLQEPDRLRVEGPLDPRPGGGHLPQRGAEHDLVRRLPEPGEVQDVGRVAGLFVQGLPDGHHLVHPPPVKMGAQRPHQVVDEGVHLLVRLGPVEAPGRILDVAVQRHERRVDQLGHGEKILARKAWRLRFDLNDAEQVSVRVFQHDVVVVRLVSPGVFRGSQPDQPRHLAGPVVGIEVQMQPAPFSGALRRSPVQGEIRPSFPRGRAGPPIRPRPAPGGRNAGPPARRSASSRIQSSGSRSNRSAIACPCGEDTQIARGFSRFMVKVSQFLNSPRMPKPASRASAFTFPRGW